MITVLYDSEQTRRTIIAAYQAGNQLMGWALRGNAGYLINPNGLLNKTALVVDVESTLEAIGGDALLVRGNSGIAITKGILVSTTNGMQSDDYVTGQLIANVSFVKGVSEVWGI